MRPGNAQGTSGVDQVQLCRFLFQMGLRIRIPFSSSAESATNLVAAGGVARGWDLEMLWGRRRDFLPGSQEVKWRDGNPPTNATVPAPQRTVDPALGWRTWRD